MSRKLVSPMEEVDDDDAAEMDASDEDENNSSDDSNTEEMDAVERRTVELRKSILTSPFVYEHHVELIKCLQKLGELEQLRAARRHMHELYPLGEELWLSWLRDEAKYCEEKTDVVSLFDEAVKDYLSVKIWLEYCQYAIGTFLAESPDKVRSVMDRALAACGNHVSNGNQIWEVAREFEMAMLAGMPEKPGDSDADKAVTVQKTRIDNLYKAQLSVPLFEMQSTYDEYCEWLDGEPDKATKMAYDRAVKMFTDRKPYEDGLLESDPPSVEAYSGYLKYEEEQGDLTRVSCLYERAITDHPLAEEFWRHYAAFLERKLSSGKIICDVYERAVRNVPWSVELWIKWAQALERACLATHEKISKIYEDALLAGFQKESDVVQTWVGYLDYLRRRVNWSESHEAELENLRSCFARAEEAINVMQERRDHLPLVLKYWAFVEAKYCQNVDKARELWHMVTRLGRGNQADLWLEYVSFERAFGDSPNTCISVFQSALNAVVDRPEAMCAAYINFAREACSIEQLDEAIAACEKRTALLKKRTKEQTDRENAKAGGGAKHTGLGFHKGKGGAAAAGGGKDGAPQKFVKPGQQRQQQQQQQPQKQPQQKKEGFAPRNDAQGSKRKFENPAASTKVAEDEGESPFKKPFAPTVPSSKAAGGATGAAAAVSSSSSTFKEPTIPPPFSSTSSDNNNNNPRQPSSQFAVRREINFSDENPTTVFLSNIDFHVTEEEIVEFFKNCGTIEDVRLVMKAQNLNRGFAYIKFADIAGAKKALEMDRQKIRDRPAFVSPYSDKNASGASDAADKKSGLIYSAGLEKNKLFVRELPLTCSEEQLKQAFAVHGPVKAARLVTFKDGKPKGWAYVEFERADDADKARQAMNGTAALGEGKLLSVEISNPPPKRTAGDLATSSSSARKGAVTAFYSNLGVGSRHHTTGQGQQTRIGLPSSSASASSAGNGNNNDGNNTQPASANGNGTTSESSSSAKMKNDDFRRFLK